MKILIQCSKYFYNLIPDIQKILEQNNHIVSFPNSYENFNKENEMKELGIKEHQQWKSKMLRISREKIFACDAILVLNYDKGNNKNYVGGATFLEIYEAFMQNKKIFFANDIPTSILTDELKGMNPIILHNDFNLIKE